MEKVKHVDISKGMKINDLVLEMKKSGVFTAGKLADAADICENMVKDKDCVVFLGLAGAAVPGGMKNVISGLLKDKWIDVFVTTGANLTHDLVEALGHSHYKLNENVSDEELNKKGYDRIYNAVMPNKVYEELEKFFKEKIFPKIDKEISIKEFLWLIGENINDKNSILRVCYENKIPIFCPALADSGIGLMIWGRLASGKKINIDGFSDMKEIIDISWGAKKTGVIYLGGGVPKNFIQQSLQFSKGADYGIQITMDRPEHGGSSGAELVEGKSWGKLKYKARYVDVICDFTIALPIIYSCLKDRVK